MKGHSGKRSEKKQLDKKEWDNRKFLYRLGLLAAAGSLFFWILGKELELELGGLLLPCLFRLLTGLYCPGCGGTRSVRLLLEGDLLGSFRFHPVVPYFAALFLWFMISSTVEYLSKGRLKVGMRFQRWQIWIAAALVIGNFLVKNAALLIFHWDILA